DLDTGAGTPVEATVDNASKAISEAKVVGQGKDLALELAYDTKAEGAYPITLVTYEIACEKGNKAETLDATKSFLGYIAGEDGQELLKDGGYAPLPTEIAEKVRTTIADLG
ncbi:phosphate-binding protein, partial [Streptomyces sp. NRRL F-6602]